MMGKKNRNDKISPLSKNFQKKPKSNNAKVENVRQTSRALRIETKLPENKTIL